MFREKLYKTDNLGRIRVWFIEYDEEKYRTHSGLLDGQIVISGWKWSSAKNVGKANETTVSEQVLLDIASIYEKQMYQGKYHTSIEESASGAKFIEPMLAHKYDSKKFKDFPYVSQPKLDGVRCLVSVDGMQTRQGKPFLSSPHIREALEPFFAEHPDAILDGELYNHDLKDDFEKIISLARKTKPTEQDLKDSAEMVQFHIYDVITEEPMSYRARAIFIKDNVPVADCIKLVEDQIVVNEEEVMTLLGEYLEAGYEGGMLRCITTPYEPKRSKGLLKHKQFDDEEVEIVDIVEGVGNWAGYAKSITVRLPNGSTQSSGMRGNQKFALDILNRRVELIGTDVTVRYQGKTGDGKMRFPVVVKFWEGKRDV